MKTFTQPEKENTTYTSYLSFVLAQERYALLVSKIVEILEVPAITKVPKTPDYMLGVMNLRGSILPIVDLHVKLGMPTEKQTINSCIVVMKIMIDGTQTLVGILVDAVHEVIPISEEQISEAPTLAGKLNKAFLTGMAKIDDNFLMILDIDAIMNTEDTQLFLNLETDAAEGIPNDEIE